MKILKVIFFIVAVFLSFGALAEEKDMEDPADKVEQSDKSVESQESETGTDGEDVTEEKDVKDRKEGAVESQESEVPEKSEPAETFEPVMVFPEKGIIIIDRMLNLKINLFPTHDNFLNARLYKGSKGNYKLVATIIENSGKLREIELDTDGIFVSNMREKLKIFYEEPEKKVAKVTLKNKKPEVKKEDEKTVPSDGRKLIRDDMGLLAEMLSASIIYSGGWGATLPFVFAGDDASYKAYVASSLIGAGLGFFAPFLALRKSEVSSGAAIGGELGGMRGSLDGFLLFTMFSGFDYNEVRLRGMLGMLTAVGMTEYALGIYMADDMNISEQNMRAVTLYSWLGYISGLELSFLIGGSGDDSLDTKGYGARLLSGAVLIGGTAGMIGGYYLAKNSHYTNGDTVVAGTAVSVVAGLPVAFTSLGRGVDARIYSGVALAGTVGGIALGHYIADQLDFLAWESALVTLGTIGGSLMGFGIAFLASDDLFDDRVGKFTIPIAIGGAVGFTSLFFVFYKNAQKRRIESSKSASNFSFSINPYAFTAIGKKHQVGRKTAMDPDLMEDFIEEMPSNTMINVQYRF